MIGESFRELADHLSQPLLLLDLDGRVVAANRRAVGALGRGLAGESLIAAAREPEALAHYLAICAGSGAPLPGALRLAGDGEGESWRCDCHRVEARPGGGGLLLLALRPRPEAAERFRLLNERIDELHREVVRRHEAERRREHALEQERRARAAAEEASRLKDEFLATVSHELRTPLNAIKGWVHLLRVQRSDADLLERGLATIEKNSDLQSQLVEDLLDVSRIITGRIRLAVEPVDLAAVVRDAVEAIRPAAEAKGVRLQVVSGNGDCAAMGDRGRLVQVVWNLLSNGVKFTPKGGRVQVVLQRINSHVEIVVSDTGEGIPPDVLPYVFDRFRQADASTTRRHGGLGLGLSIVRHLVELHGGLVLADSPGPSQGATFTVSLPVPLFTRAEGVAPAALPAGAPEESLGPAPLAGLHALLVEDHEDSLLLLREILEEAGARVTPSATSPDALAAFQAEPPDVVVSDIELPGEDGYTLIRKLRDHEARLGLRRTPAVAVTAYAGGEFRLRALRAGFHSFVPKPVAPVELLTVIAAVTGRT